MYERCLTEAERILASSRQIAVPVKEVWGKVTKLSRALGFETASLADFTAMMEADKRFEIIPSQKNPEYLSTDVSAGEDPDESELEQLGFYGEDSVKLKRIIVRRLEDDDEEQPISVKGMSTSQSHADRSKSGNANKKERRGKSAVAVGRIPASARTKGSASKSSRQLTKRKPKR